MLELAIPNVRQSTDYTCGPACALAALRYLGVDDGIGEMALANEMGCTSARGTEEADMVRALSMRWGDVQLYTDWTYDGLRDAVKSGSVCILDIQAWAHDRPPPRGYRRRQSDGHYVVATAVSPRRAVFMDPSLRVRGTLTKRELVDERWHELCEVPTLDGSPNAWESTPALAVVLAGASPRLRRLGRCLPIG